MYLIQRIYLMNDIDKIIGLLLEGFRFMLFGQYKINLNYIKDFKCLRKDLR